ncbi:hypothetical protein HZZ13_10805 [Bradyrhizobium sp. CNPSo 4010]|uniref:Uncharacterized protein n=1 Tax=Bradyrhizobium agreste TaxID=2751811 RepID=A0ABS0PM45_9BRAD|nr:hypothetical protein [Bradyrhizobium agreste]MBH5398278.1 hypothetical protein [Bradyrhizobium agreste]
MSAATPVAPRKVDNYLPPYVFIVYLNIYRGQTGFLGQDLSHMPVELLVILGAEASILGFMAAMSLHAKHMDVLSGRSFERPIISPRENRHLARSARDLLQFTGRWATSSRSFHPISCGAPITRMLRWILQIRPQTPVWFATRAPWIGTPARGACDRPAVLSGTGRNTDAHGKDASPEFMQSRAAAILHELSVP